MGKRRGTLTLPSSGTVPNNWFVMIRNNGSGILTLTPQGTDKIDGASSAQLQITESLVLVANGSGFNTFGYGRSNTFFFTQLVKSITGGAIVLTSAEAANVLAGIPRRAHEQRHGHASANGTALRDHEQHDRRFHPCFHNGSCRRRNGDDSQRPNGNDRVRRH
jgi:hypothetical protein